MTERQSTDRETTGRRFTAPLSAEKNAGFKATILRFNKNALTAAGVLGIVAPLVYLASSELLLGKHLTWKYSEYDSAVSTAVWDKLLMMVLGVICLVLSRIKLGPRWGRPVLGLVIFAGGLASVFDDILSANMSFSAGWLALLMLVSLVIPYRGWHTIVLCLSIVAGFMLSSSWIPTVLGLKAVAIRSEHLIYLLLVTLACTIISELIYGSRFHLYHSRRMLAATNIKLRDTQTQMVQSAKMASLGNLVAGIAHEINTPLGAIHSNASVAAHALQSADSVLEKGEGLPPSEIKKALEKPLRVLKDLNSVTMKASSRINNIVTALRNFARLDEAEQKRIDLHEAIESTLTILPHGTNKKIRFAKQYGELPEINCYPSQLGQVFINLLLNSVEAIDDEGTISIATRREGDWAVVQFADTGRGIAEGELRKVFDPGYTTKGVGVGTGLGLSICYRVLESHRGKIGLASKPGEGTEVTLHLPVN